MFAPFFVVAAQSPGRQWAMQQLVAVHVGLLAIALWVVATFQLPAPGPLLGHTLLIAGIVEGAILIGWRLTQVPKSQSLEFLLVSQLQSREVFLGEGLVGLTRLALVGLAGLPLLLAFMFQGWLLPADLVPLLLLPFSCGTICGLALCTWAYEPIGVRRWGERFFLLCFLTYLVVGVLAAEQLPRWLGGRPDFWKRLLLGTFRALHLYNPFGVIQFWLESYGRTPAESGAAWVQLIWLEIACLAVAGFLAARGASRLRGHFHDRHYRPISSDTAARTDAIGDRPLSWWAVQRVMEYSGRINLYIAAGFSCAYGAYMIASAANAWPSWLGQLVFQMIDSVGGVAGVTTGLIVLAAVPAAYQYGLWDSNAHDRSRRLELLLLTTLSPEDYWHAAAAAAWRRGRGYFAVAIGLWIAAMVAKRSTPLDVAGALAAGAILWGLYFSIGFRAFSRGLYATKLGLLLTAGLPALAFGVAKAGRRDLAALLPPGSVYAALTGNRGFYWTVGTVAAALIALAVARRSLSRCDRDLRDWYDKHHARSAGD